MSTSSTTDSRPTILCDCDELVRSSCRGEPSYEVHDKHYCVFHFPGPGKSEDFNKALREKLQNKDFDFRGVCFPPKISFSKFNFSQTADFSDAIFSGETDFRRVVFSNGASFCRTRFSDGADFSSATFLGLLVNFREAIFSATTLFHASVFSGDAQFIGATFTNTAAFYDAKFDSANFEKASFQVAKFSHATFKAAEFSSATFSGAADFSYATFDGDAKFKECSFNAEANFYNAKFSIGSLFSKAIFKSVKFNSVTFGGDWDPADMEDSHRKDANFEGAIFYEDASFIGIFKSEACFRSSTFKNAVYFCASFKARAIFASAVFKGVTHFKNSTFSSSADFSHATFEEYVKFEGLEDMEVFLTTYSLDLQSARVEKPERFSFHWLTLCPHFFVGIDARKFGFTNVKWVWRGAANEIETLENRIISSPHSCLAVACRQLAVNAEENDRYEDASKFRYLSMDAERREKWRGFPIWRLSWWYWLASGFGERMSQAFLVLLGILLLSAVFYTQVGFARWEPRLASEADVLSNKRDEVGAPMRFSRALTYSLGVMTLQRPEPRPATILAQAVVLLETILGPVQAALLALAIRRKFMR